MPGLLPGKQHPCCQPPCFSGVTLLLCLPGCRAGQDIYRSQDTARAAGALWRLPLVYIVMNIIRTLAIVGEVMHYCWPSPGAPVQPPHDLALPPCLNVELCPSHWLPQSWPLFRPAGCYTAQLPWSAVTVRQGLMCRDPGAELVFSPLVQRFGLCTRSPVETWTSKTVSLPGWPASEALSVSSWHRLLSQRTPQPLTQRTPRARPR